MKSFYVLSFLLALAAVSAEKYDSNNDDFDIHAAVADPDTLKALVGCFLDTAVCDEVSADFKSEYLVHVLLTSRRFRKQNDYRFIVCV